MTRFFDTVLWVIGGTAIVIAIASATGAPPQQAGGAGGLYLAGLVSWWFWQKKTPRR